MMLYESRIYMPLYTLTIHPPNLQFARHKPFEFYKQICIFKTNLHVRGKNKMRLIP